MNNSSPNLKARVDVKHPHLVMMGLYLGTFVGQFGETAMNVALPQLVQVFHVETALMQWMIIGYMLMIGIILPFASLLMKWFPIRKLTLFALTIFIAGSLISGLAFNFPMLLTGRMIQGIGAGLVIPMMYAMVLEVFPPHKLGSAMGICTLIIMFAPAIGPTLAGLIVGLLSWRWIFFIFAVVLAIALVFTLKFVVNPYEITKPKIDLFSCITSIIGFGGLVIGTGIASLYGWISVPVLAFLALGIICLALYARRQLHMDTPILNIRAFSIPGFRTGALLVMFNFGVVLSSMYLMPQYLQNSLLLPVALTGILLLPGGIVNAVLSLVAGKIFDRIGAKILVRTGFVILIIGSILLLTLNTNSPLGYVIFCHVFLMIGVPLIMSPSQSHGLGSLPRELSADGSTIMNTMQQVWGAISTAIATSLMVIGQRAFTGNGDTARFTNGFHYGVRYTLILAILGLIIAFTIKNKRKEKANVPETQKESTGNM